MVSSRRVGTRISSLEKGEPGEVRLTWETRKVLERMNRAVRAGLQSVLARAEEYWREEEWTPDRHPEMTGEERDKGIFKITGTAGNVTKILIGSSAPHAVFEEYGTIHRAGHAPIRKTLDFAAPRIRPAVRRALRKRR